MRRHGADPRRLLAITAPDYLEILYNEAEASQADTVICRRKAVSHPIKLQTVSPIRITRYYSDVLDKFLSKELRINIEPFAKLFRRKILPEKMFTPGIYYEDYELLYTHFFRFTGTLSVVDAEMYYIVQSGDSIMRSEFTGKKLDSAFTVLKNIHQGMIYFPERHRKRIRYNTQQKILHILSAGIASVKDETEQLKLCKEFQKQVSECLLSGALDLKYLRFRYRLLIGFAKYASVDRLQKIIKRY